MENSHCMGFAFVFYILYSYFIFLWKKKESKDWGNMSDIIEIPVMGTEIILRDVSLC